MTDSSARNENRRAAKRPQTEINMDHSPQVTKRLRRTPNTDFLKAMFEVMIQDAVEDGLDINSKVVEFRHPAELQKEIDLDIGEESTPDETLLSISKQIIKFSVKSGHPHFFNQLYGGFDSHGLAGAWLTDTLNTSQYTYEVAPVFTLMEKTVLTKMCELAGFKDGDAIFCPGGSVANMYGINLARYSKFPAIRSTGMTGLPPLCILTSESIYAGIAELFRMTTFETASLIAQLTSIASNQISTFLSRMLAVIEQRLIQGHYSMKKGASFLGLGMDNVVAVKSNEKGQMIPTALEEGILKSKANGMEPIMVNATSGTTVLGAYDPLNEIAAVCEKYGIWLHVDGAWGAGVLLSSSLKHLMNGIQRADSLTWNPHKMMGAPLQCSAFLTKHKNLLKECHCAKAKYLFQQDKFYDVSYDTGDKSIQCGRKVDVLKLWMMWKAKGDKQFEQDIDNIFKCSRYLTKKLKEAEGFRLVLEEPECTNVGFWYVPQRMRNKTEDQQWWKELSKVAPAIKQRMTEEGTLLIGYQPDGDKVNFFRMVVSNTGSTLQDMDFVLSEIDRLGRDL